MTTAPATHPAIAGDAPWQRAVCAYIERLRAHYGEGLAAVVLYGSRARGDADDEGSDVDLLVVLRGEFDEHDEQEFIWEQAYNLEDKYGYPLLSAIVATEPDYRHRMLPLYMNIRREGIELWPGKPKRVREDGREYGKPSREDLEMVLAKSRQTLHEAQQAIKLEMPDFAANRSYYAMFHAVTALLLSQGLAFSRHSNVIGAFNERYVKTGRFPAQLGNALSKAYEARNKADYSYGEQVASTQAGHLIENAIAFVAAIERLLGFERPPS